MGKRSRKARTGAGRRGATARGYERSPAAQRGGARPARAARARRAPARGHGRAVIAGVMAVANLALYLAGWDVRGQDPNLGGALAVCVVLGAAAIGMWRTQYWAVIGFEVLLGVLVVFAALSLMLASNVQGALLSLAVIALAGPLFWFLIRAMARIQMPQR